MGGCCQEVVVQENFECLPPRIQQSQPGTTHMLRNCRCQRKVISMPGVGILLPGRTTITQTGTGIKMMLFNMEGIHDESYSLDELPPCTAHTLESATGPSPARGFVFSWAAAFAPFVRSRANKTLLVQSWRRGVRRCDGVPISVSHWIKSAWSFFTTSLFSPAIFTPCPGSVFARYSSTGSPAAE